METGNLVTVGGRGVHSGGAGSAAGGEQHKQRSGEVIDTTSKKFNRMGPGWVQL